MNMDFSKVREEDVEDTISFNFLLLAYEAMGTPSIPLIYEFKVIISSGVGAIVEPANPSNLTFILPSKASVPLRDDFQVNQ